MADEYPQPAEDALHLQIEHIGIGVHPAVHLVGLDQPGDVVGL